MSNFSITGLLVVLFFVFLAVFTWYSLSSSVHDMDIPIGLGDGRTSPDGRLMAYATSFYQESPTGSKSWYVFEVRLHKADLAIRSKTLNPPPGTQAYNFHGPDTEIRWAPDSSNVTFLGGGKPIHSFNLTEK